MAKKFIVPVHVNNQWCNDGPTCAVIELDQAAINRIRQLARALKELKANYIEEYDSTAELHLGDKAELLEWEGSSDCNMLRVSEDDFHYTGIIKHTDITWETEGISLKELPRTR